MSEEKDTLTGKTVSGRYEIEAKIGEGAMGSVYRAKHTFINKPVALKVLHPRFSADPEIVERFQREAQAAAHIEHPNICLATDFGRLDDSAFFLVMEWLDGESLEELLEREGRLDPDRAVKLAVQIAEALEKAHELGIVHRDLKPANIMVVDKNGREFVKVTDFGIAQVRLGDSAKITQAGAAYGTPTYMSPEQASGREVDGRSDLYALGVILYEMLTDKVPFDADSIPLIMAKHVTDPPPPMAEMAPDAPIPRWLDHVVMKCMEKAPEARPQTAAELVKLLTEEPDAFAPTQRKPAVATALVQLSHAVEKTERNAPFAVYAGIAAALVLAVVIAAAAITGNVLSEQVGEMALENVAEERTEFSKQPDIAKALAMNAEGKSKQAIEALEKAGLNYESNAHYHFLLGTLHSDSDNHSKAFLSFARATELDDRYRRDEGLQKALLQAMSGKKAARDAVQEFLTQHGNKDLREAIFKEYEATDKRRDRQRIADILHDSKQLPKFDRWQRNVITLKSQTKCSELQTAVKDAIEDGDERVGEAILYVDKRPKRGCGFLNMKDCLDCVRDDLKVAKEELGLDKEDDDKKKSKKD